MAAPAGACRRTDRAGMVSRVSARQPVTIQVTALPGLAAARAFMTAGGIAGYCAPARPLRDVLPLGDAGQAQCQASSASMRKTVLMVSWPGLLTRTSASPSRLTWASTSWPGVMNPRAAER